MEIKWSKREKQILGELKKRNLSPSHELDHLTNVAKYGLSLAEKYRGDRNIVVAAALLHDLGRSRPKLHGKESSSASARLAIPILKKARYKDGEIKLITQCIEEHDQAQFSSELLESRILKDADFLDGFGMRGMLRAIYYTAEAGESFEKVLERLQRKMTDRFNGLEFLESRRIAGEGYKLVKLCLAHYSKNIIKRRFLISKGRLIVFEGISGTGKETQARLLKKFLENKCRKVELVFHPTLRLKQTLREWRTDDVDFLTEAFLFLADRKDSVQQNILPALEEGKVVISLRNWLSTLVYQAKTEWDVALIDYLYSTFEPRPDILFYLDLEPKAALERVNKRTKETGEGKGRFEGLKLLKMKRERYLGLLKHVENVIKIDASKSIDEVHKNIVKKYNLL